MAVTLDTRRPTLATIREAHERIKPYIHRTPVMTCSSIDAMVGSSLHFKCDNLQKIGAFKIRGATNAVFQLLEEEAARGVVTHSSGNHAQALALAAQWRKISAYIVMPEDAPRVKVNAVRGYGGQITFCKPTTADRTAAAERLMQETGATFIHPYDNYDVMAGQGTAVVEFLEDVPDLDVLLTPVGGGGLLAGSLIAAKELKPSLKVIGVEPERVDDAKRSLIAGHIIRNETTNTLADGLKTDVGELTFPIIKELVDDIVTAPEELLIPAMRTILERMKILVEPSSAVPLAALVANRISFPGKRVGIHIGGGNVDLTKIRFD